MRAWLRMSRWSRHAGRTLPSTRSPTAGSFWDLEAVRITSLPPRRRIGHPSRPETMALIGEMAAAHRILYSKLRSFPRSGGCWQAVLLPK
jgi:hypothetical protein